MSKWWSVCDSCGVGSPEDPSPEPTEACDHLVWTFLKEQEEEENG